MAHTAKVVAGLKELLISDINGTGLVSEADWEVLGKNLEGSFTLTQDDAEVTEIYVEESDNPILEVLKAGKKSFTTSIPDLAFEVAEKLFGATKTTVVVEGQSLTRVHLPDSAAYIYKMFKIVPTQGIEQIYFAKGQINPKINGSLTKTETLNIDLTVTALTPDSGEVAVMYDIAPGTNPGYQISDTLYVSEPNPTTNNWITTIAGIGDVAGVKITVNGVVEEVYPLIMSAVVTPEDVITELNAKTTSPATWSFDEDEYRVKLTTDGVGEGKTIAIAAPTTGTSIVTPTTLNFNNTLFPPVEGS